MSRKSEGQMECMLAVGHTLVNWHLGAAIYALAHQFDELGTIPSLLGLSVAAAMTYLVIILLVKSAVKTGVYSFSGLVATVIGPVGGIVLSVLVVLNAIGVFAAYFGILQETVQVFTVGVPLVDSLLQWGLMAFVVHGCFSRNAWEIPWANELANGALVVLVFGLLYMGVVQPSSAATSAATSAAAAVAPSVWSSALKASTISIFSFSCAEVILTFHSELKSPALLIQTGGWAILVSFLFNAVVGILGSSVRQGDVPDQILSLFAEGGVVGWVVLVTNFLSIALSIPVFIITARKYAVSIYDASLDPDQISNTVRYSLTGVLLLLAWKLDVILPQLSALVSFVSGVTDGLFMLVFPSIIALYHLHDLPLWMKGLCVAMLTYGVVQFIATLTTVAV